MCDAVLWNHINHFTGDTWDLFKKESTAFKRKKCTFQKTNIFVGISKMTPNLPARGAFKLPIKYFFPTPLSPQERLCFSLFPKIVPFNQSAVTFIADVNLQSGNSFCLFAWGSGIPPPPQPLWKNHCCSLKRFLFFEVFRFFFYHISRAGEGNLLQGAGWGCLYRKKPQRKEENWHRYPRPLARRCWARGRLTLELTTSKETFWGIALGTAREEERKRNGKRRH